MPHLRWIVFIWVFAFSLGANSQNLWDGIYNRMGPVAGVHQFGIVSDDFEIKEGISWNTGFTARAFLFDNFQLVYGLGFYDFQTTLTGREKKGDLEDLEDIKYRLTGLQVNALGSLKLFDHFLSVEAGPVVQLNGRNKPRQDKELYYIKGYDLQANDLRKISPLNFNFAIGLTGGFENLKFWVQYQHGLNNVFKRLNGQGLINKDPGADNLRGRIKIFSLGAVLFL